MIFVAALIPPDFSLRPDQVEGIVSFLGYGNPDAPVWFIGIEEGLGAMDPADLLHNLEARSSFEPVMDLYQAHRQLQENGKPIDIEQNPPGTQVWQYMAKIMLAREGKFRPEHPKNGVENYVRSQLGRFNRETFLTESSPVPCRQAGQNIDWLNLLQKWDRNVEGKIEERKHQLKEMLKNRKVPPLVIYYSNARARSDEFASLLGVKWQEIAASSKIKESRDSQYLLLPFFGYGRISHNDIVALSKHLGWEATSHPSVLVKTPA